MRMNEDTREKLSRTSTIVFGLALAAAGLVVGIVGINELTGADASASWPSVKGRVIVSQVKRGISSRGAGRNRRRSTSHTARIVYDYAVSGRKHIARRVSFGATSAKASAARAMVRRYPKGAEVTVYYDPDDPDRAVLEPGTSSGTYLPLGVGVLLAAGGGFLAVGGVLARNQLGTPDPEALFGEGLAGRQ